jgi:hypothetical protein
MEAAGSLKYWYLFTKIHGVTTQKQGTNSKRSNATKVNTDIIIIIIIIFFLNSYTLQ